MQDTSNARRASHRRLAFLLGPAVLVGGLAIGGTAHAAVGGTARPASLLYPPCSSQMGTTATLDSSGTVPRDGTTFVEGSCGSMVITKIEYVGKYAGYFQNADLSWQRCAPGYVELPHLTGSATLCAGIKPGTPLKVVALDRRDVKITVTV